MQQMGGVRHLGTDKSVEIYWNKKNTDSSCPGLYFPGVPLPPHSGDMRSDNSQQRRLEPQPWDSRPTRWLETLQHHIAGTSHHVSVFCL